MKEERRLHDEFEKYLIDHNYLYIHSRMDKPTTNQVGLPDFVVFTGYGQVCLIEFKTATGKVRPKQKVYFDKLAHRGYSVKIARSVQEAVKWLLENNSSELQHGIETGAIGRPQDNPYLSPLYVADSSAGKMVVQKSGAQGWQFVRAATENDVATLPRRTGAVA